MTLTFFMSSITAAVVATVEPWSLIRFCLLKSGSLHAPHDVVTSAMRKSA